MISPSYIDQYKSEGYCIIPDLLPRQSVEKVLKDIHHIFCLQLARFSEYSSQNIETNFKSLLDFDTDAYLAAARRSAKLASLQRIMSEPKILETIQGLGVEVPTIPTEQVLHINSNKLRIPGGYFGFDTHQDWTAIQGSLDCVTVWAPLVSVTETNFPLQVIPGSHTQGLLDGKITNNYFEVNPEQYDEENYISVAVEPGDVIFMSAWTLHRTGIENCTGFRLSASTRYENAAEPTFIERNYPCAYIRTVNREPITPGFPSHSQVKNVFNK